MRNLIIMGSPRKNGHSASILKKLDISRKSKVVWAYDMKVLPCTGCGKCIEDKACFIKDDMAEIYSEIEKSQCVMIIAPVYFFGYPAPLKAIIDRTQVFYNHPLRKEKQGAVILTGESSNESFAACYKKAAEYIAEYWGINLFEFVLSSNVKKEADIKIHEIKKQLSSVGIA